MGIGYPGNGELALASGSGLGAGTLLGIVSIFSVPEYFLLGDSQKDMDNAQAKLIIEVIRPLVSALKRQGSQGA